MTSHLESATSDQCHLQLPSAMFHIQVSIIRAHRSWTLGEQGVYQHIIAVGRSTCQRVDVVGSAAVVSFATQATIWKIVFGSIESMGGDTSFGEYHSRARWMISREGGGSVVRALRCGTHYARVEVHGFVRISLPRDPSINAQWPHHGSYPTLLCIHGGEVVLAVGMALSTIHHASAPGA
jgi:hypothetical protein